MNESQQIGQFSPSQEQQKKRGFMSKQMGALKSAPMGWFLLGTLAGSLVTFMFDPIAGARRRSLIRDKGVHLKKASSKQVARKARDLQNRARGMMAEHLGSQTTDQQNEQMTSH